VAAIRPFVKKAGSTHGSSGVPSVNFPIRVMLALFVIGAFGGIAVWGLVVVLRAERLTEAQRVIAAGGIVLVIALLAMWVIFVWPAYWD
jgi:hypothetical protein